ncbi:tumor necrosis factor receptor superfamily member 26-like isoform X1 [Actinia tenebrosa]|uniref:Tumor necrosis factor receptor superfamily member 26-like isoform X1 n=1 Tax=Actinia tenebrosa TaxID=6105 RepID=A0A6P8HHV2_ACTTE|nr:tumor necrosis factor receptor superfamily member 26-like isoform X1 [Actinia tenebrosa]
MGSTFSNMVVTTLLSSCLLMMHLNAAPVCNFHKLKHDEIGLCGPNGTTWHCPSCQPGYGQLVECGRKYPEGTKVGCVPCKENHTYSDTYDISQCKQCTRCQENEVQSGQCTRENDTIRCTCKRGYYRDRGHCKPCSWCCGDKTNEKVPECNIPQVVPMGKQCSLQTARNCAPTTPAPSTISITTVIAPITSPMTAFTTEQTSSKESKNRSNSININTNDPESTTKD